MRTLFLICTLCLCSIPVSSYAGEWYEGGTLHRASVSVWEHSSYGNKLATAADWALASPTIKQRVMDSGTVATMKPYARELVSCVNQAISDGSAPKASSAAEIAAMCMILLGYR